MIEKEKTSKFLYDSDKLPKGLTYTRPGGNAMTNKCDRSMNESKYCFHAAEDQCRLYGTDQSQINYNCEASLMVPEDKPEEEEIIDHDLTAEVKKTLWQKIKEKIVSIFTV